MYTVKIVFIQNICTVGHKSNDPCFHVFLMEAGVMTFCDPLYSYQNSCVCIRSIFYHCEAENEGSLVYDEIMPDGFVESSPFRGLLTHSTWTEFSHTSNPIRQAQTIT